MSNPSFKDLLSKSLQEDLKQMTKASTKPEMASDKPNETVNLPSSKAILHEVKRFNHDAINDDTVLFMQAMSGVIPLKPMLSSAIPNPPKPMKICCVAVRQLKAMSQLKAFCLICKRY